MSTAALPTTAAEVVALLNQWTDEKKSLAWSPEPPSVPTGPHDCRMGGDCGLDFNYETPRARWRQARYRWRKHNGTQLIGGLQ